MIRPKNETEDSSLSTIKNCETLIEQTHRKAEETSEFELTKLREIFLFTPPIQIIGDWSIGLTNLQVYNSIFNTTEENNKIELYKKFPNAKSSRVSFEKIRDEKEKDLKFKDITATDLQDDIIGPIIIEENRNQVTKRMKEDKYMRILSI